MESSPEELISKLEDMVECAICLEQFEDPRSLPCQHSFCRKCLEGMLGPEKKIRCPCCNKEALVPSGVQGLPVDFRANSWLEIMSEYQKAKEAREAEAAQAETAPTAQEVPEVTSGDQLCPICEQFTSDSKALSCGHRLCANCVQFLLPVGGDTLHCPTCSSQTTIIPTPSLMPRSGPQSSQPESPPVNEPLYQTLFELLGGRPQTGVRTQRAQPSAPPGMPSEGPQPAVPSVSNVVSPVEKLKFHPRCGKNAVVLSDQITAHRKDPMLWGEAIVFTSQQLKPNQLFEVRVDKKYGQWSGSIQIGITTHSPAKHDFPSALHELSSGTWYMTGRRVRHNNRTIIEEYGQNSQHDLNHLEAGNRVGVQRRSDGTLHFYINGVDLGVAASFIPAAVYGIIDIFGKTEHVTLIDKDADTESTPTPPLATPTPTPRSLYPDLTAVSVSPLQAVEGMSMPQMLSMLELLTKAVAKSQKEDVPESIGIPSIPRFKLPPSTEKPPATRVPSRPAPVCPPQSPQLPQQDPPAVPTTPRPFSLNQQRPQEGPPSPPKSPRPNLLNLRPRDPPPAPPSPSSPCPTPVSGRGPPPPPPPSRTRPVFPPSTNETSPAPTLVGSTGTSGPLYSEVDTGNRLSQDVATSASACSGGPKQGLRVSLADVLSRKSSLKKTAKQ